MGCGRVAQETKAIEGPFAGESGSGVNAAPGGDSRDGGGVSGGILCGVFS
jgi:hypothetical protein